MKLVFLRLPCDESNRELIQSLTKAAEGQSDAYERIYPWRYKCKENQILYVCLVANDIMTKEEMIRNQEIKVLGWMNVSFETRKGKCKRVTKRKRHTQQKQTQMCTLRKARVDELSTSRTPSEFKRIGSLLLNQLKAEKIDFIELIPLKEAVEFYRKQGFEFYSPSSLMFYVKSKPPSKKYIDYLYQRSLEANQVEHDNELEIWEEIKDQVDESMAEEMEERKEEDETFLYTILELYESSGMEGVLEFLE